MKKLENKAEYLPLSELVKLENNPRTIKKADFEKLKTSIKSNPDYFEARPIICSDRTGKNVILGGNQRYEAAKALGLKEVPVIVLHGLDEAREREIVIRDNVNNGDWDFDILANEWDASELEDWGVEADWPSDEEDVVEDEAPEVNESGPAESQLGGVYQLGEHRLMCGDSTDAGSVAILMDGRKADMVFTDPPYGYEYQSNMRTKTEKFDVIENDDKKLDFMPTVKQFSSGFVFICTTWKVLKEWLEIFTRYYDLSNMIIWNKGGGGIGDLKHTFLTDYEIILCSNNNKQITGKRIGSVWNIPKDNANDYIHATQKPVELSATAIQNTTNENDKVLDLFGGSGSTLIACEQTGRKCYMMELDPKYCDVIRKRYWKFKTGSEEGWQEGTAAA